LLLHDQADRDVAVEPRFAARFFDAVGHRRDFLQPHRVSALAADDQLAELGGVAQLPVGLQRERLRGAFERADRRVGIGGSERPGQLVETDVARRERVGWTRTRTAKRFWP
jgi:hypothetical protein